MPTGDYANHRYCKLKQITAANVHKLEPAWTFSTGVLRGHEGGPLVIGDVMYVHSPFPNKVFAINLNNDGKIMWKYEPKQDPAVIPVMCCDTVNRGLAYADGKIFLQQADTTLVALDAKTGKVVWSVKNGDPKGETNTNAPVVVKDKVIAGISGGEFGVRGHLTAYDIKTGKLAWKAYSMGPDSDMLIDPEKTTELGKPVGADLRSKTWQGDQWKIGGGTTWGWYSYDPEAEPDLLRLGQPVDLEPEAASGRQQVVDVDLGARSRHRRGEVGLPDDAARRVGLRRHQRDDPGRHPDARQDEQGAGALRPQRLRLHAGPRHRRAAGRREVRPGGELGDQGRHGQEPKTRPSEVVAQVLHRAQRRGRQHQGRLPGGAGHEGRATGGVLAQDRPVLRADQPRLHELRAVQGQYTAGQPYVGATLSMFPPPLAADSNMGNFIAWDAATARSSGRIPSSSRCGAARSRPPAASPVLRHAGGLSEGVDAKTGKELYKFKTPVGHHRQRHHLEHKGKQYIGVLSGIGGWAGIGMAAGLRRNDGLGAVGGYKDLAKYTELGGVLTVFALPGAAARQ